ncbi:MAG TPA: DUF1786 family protein, partial [Dehalococcoidia bacterium]|nr:DUF1786 family protein [Dehalococcoidia bacterium]
TPEAARTFDDDLSMVEPMGVKLASGEELAALGDGVDRIEMRDLDLRAVRQALSAFEVDTKFDGLALGCLDHGASPPGYSDRLFRFEHLRRVVEGGNSLLSFAYLPHEVPEYLTRACSMLNLADPDVPTLFMDTGPAAALGALQDPQVGRQHEQLVLNLGNMHALAFHLRGTHIHSLYEHHTGEMSLEQIEGFTRGLMAGTLLHQDVFGSKGHGVLYVDDPEERAPFLAVTGPQRSRLRESSLQPYLAVPHGDMMISGCFGLVWGFAEKHPQHREEITARLGVERFVTA